MADWTHALTTFVHAPASADMTWMVVGSAATVLQGGEGIVPGDVDILVHPHTTDEAFERLADWLVAEPTCRVIDASPHGSSNDLADFVSSSSTPILRCGEWTLGRWYVDGHKLEVARIRGDLGDGPIETQGLVVWEHRRMVEWRGTDVPVVPLEIQWATLALRGQTDRQSAIARTPGLAWDPSLARDALRARQLDLTRHLDRPSPMS